MNKFEFLTGLRAKLWSIPEEDAKASVEYYSEMIDDRMEEGLSEEEAVAAIGDLDEIVKNILADAPVVQAAAPAVKPRRQLQWWEILLLVLGSPVWGSLLIAAAAVVFSVWIALWSVVISLYAAAVALSAAAIGCVIACFFMVWELGAVPVAIGAAMVCAGLAILIFMLSNLAAKGMVALTKLIWKGIFYRKGQAV